jgi:hypothetical protein
MGLKFSFRRKVGNRVMAHWL